MRSLALHTALLASILVAPIASASETFPPVVRQFAGSAREPECTICHQTNSGGTGTATKPFAEYMRKRRLVAKDVDALRTALRAMQGEGHDTDNDGVTDFEELKAGTDPNGEFASDVPPVEYGCGRVASAGPAHDSLAAAAAAFVAAALVIRRRRPRR
jgi:MYXO-CTERM domain-containing protein